MKTKENEESPDSKASLMKAARSIFAQKGYDGATVKDLAEAAEVNVSLVSYYFGGKEGLYRACIEQFGLRRLEETRRILKNPESIEDFKVKLKIFFEGFVEHHFQELDTATIIHRDCMSSTMTVATDLFKNIFLKVFETLQLFVEEAKRKGIVKKEVDVTCAMGLVFGGFIHHLRVDEMAKQLFGRTLSDKKYLEKYINQATLLLVEGIVNQEQGGV